MKRLDSRKPNRWPGYNYSIPGWYFVTVCVKDFKCILGNVINKEMRLNQLEKIVFDCLKNIPKYYKGVELDEWAVMPDHIHGIIIIKYAGTVYNAVKTKL